MVLEQFLTIVRSLGRGHRTPVFSLRPPIFSGPQEGELGDEAGHERYPSDVPMDPSTKYNGTDPPKRTLPPSRAEIPEPYDEGFPADDPRVHKSHSRVAVGGGARQLAQEGDGYDGWDHDPHDVARDGDEAVYVAGDYQDDEYWVERPRIVRRVPGVQPDEYYEVEAPPREFVTQIRGYPPEVVDDRENDGVVYYAGDRVRPVERLARGAPPVRGRHVVRGGLGPHRFPATHGEPGFGRAMYRRAVPGHFARGRLPRQAGRLGREGIQPDELEHHRVVRMGAPVRFARGTGVRMDRGRGRASVMGVGGARPGVRRLDSLGLDINAPGYYRKGDPAPERYNPEVEGPEEFRREESGRRWDKVRTEEERGEEPHDEVPKGEVVRGRGSQKLGDANQQGAVKLGAGKDVVEKDQRTPNGTAADLHEREACKEEEEEEEEAHELSKSPSPHEAPGMVTPPSRRRRPSRYRSECPSPPSDYYEMVLASRKR